MDIRIGHGYDVHALAEGLRLVLCGVEIEHTKGCVAHSDGDVAIHALCDALLGALALGDIGKHFPDTSSEFKGIDSKILLARVMELVRAEGWEVANVDVTIAMQKPKLAPYIVPMRECMAGVMGVDVSAVSVKATTTEKLGFVGRSEGCEEYAVALLERQSLECNSQHIDSQWINDEKPVQTKGGNQVIITKVDMSEVPKDNIVIFGFFISCD